MKFVLEINLDQKMTYEQIADAIQNTASSLRTLRATISIHPESHGVYLHDPDDAVPSERIGTWTITGPSAQERQAISLSVASAQTGKSIFQVAKAQGVTNKTVIDRACAIANGAGPE